MKRTQCECYVAQRHAELLAATPLDAYTLTAVHSDRSCPVSRAVLQPAYIRQKRGSNPRLGTIGL
jgi:hypothetical protein